METSCQLHQIVEEELVFEPIGSVNQGHEHGKFMSFQWVDDSYYDDPKNYIALANRLERSGVSEFLTWISSNSSKKLVADNEYCTVTRESKWDHEATLRFKEPIKIQIGVVSGTPTIVEADVIKGTFTFEWFWLTNGRQDKVANGFEVYFDCQEFLLESEPAKSTNQISLEHAIQFLSNDLHFSSNGAKSEAIAIKNKLEIVKKQLQ